MKKIVFLTTILLVVSLLFSPTPSLAQGNLPVVNAVLFYSPTCPHCHAVINDTLLPMIDKYGDQLQIIGIDVSTQQGQILFMAAMRKFKLQEAGVPFLVIDDKYLIGSVDIPAQFPPLVDAYLAQGGVDFPDIPGLSDVLPKPTATPYTDTPQPTSPVEETPIVSPTEVPAPVNNRPLFTSSEDLTWQQRFAQDRVGNSLAVTFLVAMLGVSIWSAARFLSMDGDAHFIKDNRSWLIPLISVVGIGVAGYLAYVETAQVSAVCGPVGDCNTVQQSEYARLFGILPIGVLGLVGYVAIILSWAVARFSNGRISNAAILLLCVMTVFGTLFSMYLTFLEPFVIGATCAWCLTSAALMTVLMALMVSSAKFAWKELRG